MPVWIRHKSTYTLRIAKLLWIRIRTLKYQHEGCMCVWSAYWSVFFAYNFWYLYARIHIYFNIMQPLYSYLKFEESSYSFSNNTYVGCCWFRLSITQHIHDESHNKYELRANTRILTRRLGVCVCSVFFCLYGFFNFN